MNITQLHHLHALCDEVLLGSGNQITKGMKATRGGMFHLPSIGDSVSGDFVRAAKGRMPRRHPGTGKPATYEDFRSMRQTLAKGVRERRAMRRKYSTRQGTD